ncbi:hypothetical protein GCM10010522_65930 [Kribbella solani]
MRVTIGWRAGAGCGRIGAYAAVIGGVSLRAPDDPRVFHGYFDAPRHTGLVLGGAWVGGICGVLGLLGIAMLGVPSDPCVPDDAGCGGEPMTFAKGGAILLLVAVLAAAWSIGWTIRAGRYRSHHPTGPHPTQPGNPHPAGHPHPTSPRPHPTGSSGSRANWNFQQ